jgi:antagonist of KipI
MADRQTTGGYARLGHLAAADRAKAAQLWPGDAVRFVPITVDEARRARRQQADAQRATQVV